MNTENKNLANESEKSADKVNETGQFLIQSHFKIFDPESGDVFIFDKG